MRFQVAWHRTRCACQRLDLSFVDLSRSPKQKCTQGLSSRADSTSSIRQHRPLWNLVSRIYFRNSYPAHPRWTCLRHQRKAQTADEQRSPRSRHTKPPIILLSTQASNTSSLVPGDSLISSFPFLSGVKSCLQVEQDDVKAPERVLEHDPDPRAFSLVRIKEMCWAQKNNLPFMESNKLITSRQVVAFSSPTREKTTTAD